MENPIKRKIIVGVHAVGEAFYKVKSQYNGIEVLAISFDQHIETSYWIGKGLLEQMQNIDLDQLFNLIMRWKKSNTAPVQLHPLNLITYESGKIFLNNQIIDFDIVMYLSKLMDQFKFIFVQPSEVKEKITLVNGPEQETVEFGALMSLESVPVFETNYEHFNLLFPQCLKPVDRISTTKTLQNVLTVDFSNFK